MLSHKYGLGTLLLFAIIVVPILMFGVEFVLAIALSAVDQNSRFADSERYSMISLVLSIAVTLFVYTRLNSLVIASEQDW